MPTLIDVDKNVPAKEASTPRACGSQKLPTYVLSVALRENACALVKDALAAIASGFGEEWDINRGDSARVSAALVARSTWADSSGKVVDCYDQVVFSIPGRLFSPGVRFRPGKRPEVGKDELFVPPKSNQLPPRQEKSP